MKNKLIGSASTIDGLREQIMKKWYWHRVQFKVTGEVGVWTVLNNERDIDGLRVIKRGDRYRLEDSAV